MLEGGGAPGMSRLVQPEADLWAHGCRAGTTPSRLTIVRSTSGRPAGIGQGLGRGPHPHDDVHRDATGRTVAHARGRAPGRLVLAGVSLPHHEAERRERDGTTGMEQADVPDFHPAFGPDVLPTFWEVQVTVRSMRPTMRRLEMATLKT
jgi:hypothetical protein